MKYISFLLLFGIAGATHLSDVHTVYSLLFGYRVSKESFFECTEIQNLVREYVAKNKLTAYQHSVHIQQILQSISQDKSNFGYFERLDMYAISFKVLMRLLTDEKGVLENILDRLVKTYRRSVNALISYDILNFTDEELKTVLKTNLNQLEWEQFYFSPTIRYFSKCVTSGLQLHFDQTLKFKKLGFHCSQKFLLSINHNLVWECIFCPIQNNLARRPHCLNKLFELSGAWKQFECIREIIGGTELVTHMPFLVNPNNSNDDNQQILNHLIKQALGGCN